MTDFLNQYLGEINRKIKNGNQDWGKVLINHREIIKFMQHERLIHLLVTLTLAILFFMVILAKLVVGLLLLILLVPYIFHYFKLENGVQKMYWIDKLIQGKVKD